MFQNPKSMRSGTHIDPNTNTAIPPDDLANPHFTPHILKPAILHDNVNPHHSFHPAIDDIGISIGANDFDSAGAGDSAGKDGYLVVSAVCSQEPLSLAVTLALSGVGARSGRGRVGRICRIRRVG
jgi:hypothetical protein